MRHARMVPFSLETRPKGELRMNSVYRTVIRCLVCGSTEVRTDEVIDRGLVFLGECPRCEHRWTARPAAPPVRLARVWPVAEARREVDSAA